MDEKKVGVVTHYFPRIGVAAIQLTDGRLRVGDGIRILGHTSEFTQTVHSMQIHHQPVHVAEKGQSVAVKVVERARRHDLVLKISPA